jgi:hypothetical protein
MNLWSKFKELLPDTPQQLGIITADNGNNLYTILLYGGGFLTCSGVGFSVGNNVYVRGKIIEGKAPNLPVFISDIY